MRKLLTLLSLIIPFQNQLLAHPDEGMWLPMFIKRLNAEEIKAKGCKLTPEEIYSINNSSLKDAIVWLEGCTAELISSQGLILTNHHCAYGGIQQNSSVENNYLDNGFWAKTLRDELPVKGQNAYVLVRMEDATALALEGIDAKTDEATRESKVAANIKAAEEKYAENGKYRVIIRDMFQGNEYYMFIYEAFQDVRLVGAPPQNIGKFGGDTDNWMWPRHTGDFSLMRIYTGKDGKSAEFSEDNIPYVPRHVIPVSLEGYKEGDYAMIMGFPGRTNRYANADFLELTVNQINPIQIDLLGARLESWKKHMNADVKIRIQYSSKYARTSNGWKYYIGQNQGLKKLRVVDERKKEELEFQKWVDADPSRKAKYGDLLAAYGAALRENQEKTILGLYYQLGLKAPEVFRMAAFAEELATASEKPENAAKKDELKKQTLEKVDAFRKDYNAAADQEVCRRLYAMVLERVKAQDLPEEVNAINKTKGEDVQARVNEWWKKAVEKSILFDAEKLNAFLNAPSLKKLQKDPVYKLYKNVDDYQKKNIAPVQKALQARTAVIRRNYFAGLREFNSNKKMYPDANSTLRMTYGSVLAYEPYDAVHYDYFTTTDGLLEKYVAADSEFDLPAGLLDLIKKRDFGNYAENGVMKVAFLTNNDITGGNSGSPVLNARGELIGCAFDGNWEAMSGDIAFDSELKRTICVDIRYVLFIIDKYAKADHLIKEMKLVGKSNP